jgi:hypothetical protein
MLDDGLFLCYFIYPPSHMSCPFSFMYCILEQPGSMVSRRRRSQFHTQSFCIFQCLAFEIRRIKSDSTTKRSHGQCQTHELSLRCYQWAELSPPPLTAVVRRKRKRRAADGEVIIKWNAFSPFASSNTRGTF